MLVYEKLYPRKDDCRHMLAPPYKSWTAAVGRISIDNRYRRFQLLSHGVDARLVIRSRSVQIALAAIPEADNPV